MAEEQDDAQKTEEPTHKRLQDAFKKGQKASSREINNFFILIALTFFVATMMPGVMGDLHNLLKPYIMMPDQYSMEYGGFYQKMSELLGSVLVLMVPFMLMMMVAALAGGMIQNRINFALESIKPKWSKVSPLKGLKRLFSLRSLVEFSKGIVKISVVGVVSFAAFYSVFDMFELLPDTAIEDAMKFAQEIAVNMLMGTVIVVFLIAAVDYAYQKFEFIKNLRMTKQEVKDEYKQQEGDPLVKQKLRQIRMERARNNMMANVQEADVVVTNPTHYAIALKYDSNTMNAPMVVGKGLDKVALRIRELAERHDIPIVRNPPMARILYDDAEMDAEIPLQYYKAVAEIIGYVYKLKGLIPDMELRNTKKK